MSDLGNREIFSKNLRYYMNLNNIDRNKLCTALKLPYSTVTDWINGNSYPNIGRIEMLANYFGIEKSDLIEDREKQEKDKAFFRVMQSAKDKGYTAEDVELALNFIERARKRDEENGY